MLAGLDNWGEGQQQSNFCGRSKTIRKDKV